MNQTKSILVPHTHHYGADTAVSERRSRVVVGITATMMVVEIIFGIVSNSMALLADGWHMSTHVAAFVITALAYYFSRRYAGDPRFSFGTGKMGVLGGFVSAVMLAMVALFMAGESFHRVFAPLPIHFDIAIAVAVSGLLVNLVCAVLLKDDPQQVHRHGHGDHDLNKRAAYLHVLADAFTSVTAIVALLAGRFFGWSWLDPVMGFVGSAVVAVWAYGLVRDTGGILLDRTPETSDLADEIRRAVECDGDSLITDLHIWQVAAGRYAAIVSVEAREPKSCNAYRDLIREHEELVHVTVEVQRCHDRERVVVNA